MTRLSHFDTLMQLNNSPLRKFTRPEYTELESRTRDYPKKIVVGFLSLFLFYMVIRYSIPTGLSRELPDQALSFNSHNVAAVVGFAEHSIMDAFAQRAQAITSKKRNGDLAQKPVNLADLKKMLIGAIALQPLNAKAFRLLGQISELENDKNTTQKMMVIAAQQSLIEVVANEFMMKQSIAASNSRATIYYADILMRSNTDAMSRLAPFVARLFEYRPAQGELIRRLGANPPWRAYVLRSFSSSGLADFQAPLVVFAAMSDGPHPIVEKELSGYINYLLQRQLYAFAFSVWRQFLPAGAKTNDLVFNGSFEREPSGLIFDWNIGQTSDTKVGIFPRPDGDVGSALFISFGLSRATFPAVEEMITLKSGAYHLKGRVFGDLQARRGLQWRISCIEGGTVGESKMLSGHFPKWETFEFDIAVPNNNCSAQYLRLVHSARSPSEQFVSGYIWFDEISVAEVNSTQVLPPYTKTR